MILQRYLFQEVFRSFTAVLAVLCVIYIGHRFGRFLVQASAGSVPPELIMELTLLKIAENLPTLLPLALFLAVMLALGRLYKDSEMIAMSTGGMGDRQVATALLAFSTGFALVVLVVSLFLAPAVVELQEQIMDEAKERTPVVGLQPGQFRDLQGGAQTVYVQDVTPDGRSLLDVFMRQFDGEREDIIVSEKAYPSAGEAVNELFWVLEDGHRYSARPGALEVEVTRFSTMAFRFELGSAAGHGEQRKLRAVPSEQLLSESRLDYAAELHWRLAMPLSVLVLTALAVPLAKTTPREGRYAKLMTGVLIYLVYSNAIGIAQNMVERGGLPVALGFWPPHVVAGAFALFFFWFRSPHRRGLKRLRVPGGASRRRGSERGGA